MSRARRFILLAIILAIIIPPLRPFMAMSLADRAQTYLVYGHYDAAFRYIKRALWFDDRSGMAEDELGFLGSFASDPESLRRVDAYLTRYLALRPDDAQVMWDRGMIRYRLGLRKSAYGDIRRASQRIDNPTLRKLAQVMAAADRFGRLNDRGVK